MKQPIVLGQTDYTALVFIPDSASTVGKGKTGLVAANLTCSYVRVETDNDVTVTDVTSSLNNLASLTAAHNDWGILEVSATLAAGLYRIDFADAVFAAGAWSAVVYVCVTTGLAAASPMEFQLNTIDPFAAQVPANTTQLAGQTVTAAAGVTFPTSVASPTNITAGTITTVTNLTNAATAGDLTATMKTSVTAAVPTVGAIADQVWDEAIAGHLGAGSTGLALNSAGAAGDPWSTALPGAYGAGTAGKIVGGLTFTVAGQLDANVLAISGDATAADNLETMLDGTGGQILSLRQLNVVNSSGDAIVATAGTSGSGLKLTGAGSLHGLDANGGSGGGDGIRGTGVGAGKDIRGVLTGDIIGSVSGSVASVVGAVGSVTAMTTANVIQISGDTGAADNAEAFFDGTGYAGTNNVIPLVTVTTTATTATNLTNAPTNGDLTATMKASVTAAVPTAIVIADAFLDRNMATGTDSGSPTVRTPRQALRFLRNKWAVAAGTLTVSKEDDTTASWTAAITDDAAALPVVGSDPA